MKKVIVIVLSLLIIISAIYFITNSYINNNESNNNENNDVNITGIWRAYGYKDTAYIVIDENLNFKSYYATGIQENTGKIIKENNYVFNLKTSDDKHIMTIQFNSDFKEFEIKEDNNIKYIKDDGDAISQKQLEETINNCLYMYNEVLTEEFALEYYDDYKKAAYDSDSKQNIPSKLFNNDEDIPPTLYIDNLTKSYFEVYNFKTINEFKEHLSNYFTKEYISNNIQSLIDENLFEYENKLYLVRGSRGYGAESIDFDSIDINVIPNLEVSVNINLFNNFEKTVSVNFKLDDGKYKIDSCY